VVLGGAVLGLGHASDLKVALGVVREESQYIHFGVGAHLLWREVLVGINDRHLLKCGNKSLLERRNSHRFLLA